ncbi:DUF928 domain-containing protein [Pseudanabaena sp. lw0831]|uniref:DUF928 domain-containing protein n=1 Tax=Pseudanabaena sp. lw0831 TaxID=1357935 RepID=UPI0019156A0A|nr:DUF928 domain-containing protein [Pseudanabaena sp. lw0831]
MTSTKNQIKISIKKAIALCTICVVTVATPNIFVPSASAQYGLGLPKSAGSGGATRSVDSLPQVTILVPGDGARTLASRPTFYWYIAPQDIAATTSNPPTTVPQVDDGKGSFKVTFFLRDGNERASKSIFKAEGKAQGAGLYKFTLPENAPELKKGKVQRWQIRWEGTSGSVQVDVNALIRRDDDPLVAKAIASAKSDLEKARIYAKSTYWYDAIDAYTSWISKNPKDNEASAERSNLLKVGLPNNLAFINVKKDEKGIETEEFVPARFTNFLTTLDKSKRALSISLESKKN